ncbi:hypothetical protein [Methanoculleus sp.]|jgi:hypothetical protein|uniref:hypothetical protein n=1 Tax=Methanoculleus sp. TaxID=90427 RepID=UPI002600621E|nr:hypothetical protein [Methanoculleus sp.]MCK9319800.1 hypothetical protein [Methanoculleus sp.]
MYESKSAPLQWTDVGNQEVWEPVIQDLLNSEAVLLSQYPKRGVNSIQHNFVARSGRNPSVGPTLSLDSITGSNAEKIELTHKLKQYKAAVFIEDARVLESSKNGIGPLKDAWASEFEYVTKDLAYNINTALYADSQTEGFGSATANPVDGLRGLLKTTGTIYGQGRSNYAVLAANVDDTTTTWTFAAFRGWLTTLRKNGAKNLRVYTTHEIKDIILNKMDANKLYLGTSAEAGFVGMPTVDGVTIVADKDCPDSHIFIVDMDATYMAEFKPISMGAQLGKTNLTDTKYLWGIFDIVFTRFNTSYKITGITA